ncbi:hypothetical protein PL8927_270099 [Planktothrix serta PCC 8927]|uniref:Uncharacterized protein n=1 Tax=Planktothrix serta PCC 8927 TaxID=671068 RepID=A0A7Z9BHD0_9CYAN|nr:hypothetical protein PL8927_270099 [Planktothrix serta PCC 8927]
MIAAVLLFKTRFQTGLDLPGQEVMIKNINIDYFRFHYNL